MYVSTQTDGAQDPWTEAQWQKIELMNCSSGWPDFVVRVLQGDPIEYSIRCCSAFAVQLGRGHGYLVMGSKWHEDATIMSGPVASHLGCRHGFAFLVSHIHKDLASAWAAHGAGLCGHTHARRSHTYACMSAKVFFQSSEGQHLAYDSRDLEVLPRESHMHLQEFFAAEDRGGADVIAAHSRAIARTLFSPSKRFSARAYVVMAYIVTARFRHLCMDSCAGEAVTGIYSMHSDYIVMAYIVMAGEAVTGIYSMHSNRKEDRVWKLQCAALTGKGVSSVTGATRWLAPTPATSTEAITI